jgi:hypothetical protein
MRTVVWFVLLTGSVLLFPSCFKDECTENPLQGCACNQIYDPVCGCNNKTYGNSCEADCAGISSYTPGACGK